MATSREARRVKALQKKKKTRQRAKSARAARTRQAATTPSKAANWPTGECYISESWYEWGASVYAAFSRVHHDGTTVGALFRVELETGAIVSAETLSGVTEQQFVGWVADKTEGDTLVSTEPAHVVHLGDAAETYGARHGLKPPARWRDVRKLFGSTDPADSPHEITLGHEGEDEVTEECVPKPSLGQRVLGWLGRS